MGFFSSLFGGLFSKKGGSALGAAIKDTAEAAGNAYLDAAVEAQYSKLDQEIGRVKNPELRASLKAGIVALRAGLIAAYGAREVPTTGAAFNSDDS